MATPALSASTASPSPAGQRGRAAALLAALFVLGFAFLSASVPVQNSDFWMHLACGRLLAEGGYAFGTDPFAYTTAGVYWANHAWLFDLGVYLLFAAGGGVAIVVAKGLTATAAAGVLLSCRRPGSGWGLPAAATTLAVLAMGPRLRVLQPALLSVLLLAVTVGWLWAPWGRRRWWGLPVLFALWVNVDAWFFLGPAAVTLAWLGERLQPGERPGRPVPAWLVAAAWLACLAGPHHVRAFVLPPELSPAVRAAGFADDPAFAQVFQSPWDLTRYVDPARGLNAAGLAYFVLLLASLASFAANPSALRSDRFLLWLGAAGLGALSLRAVPFFAVVAGPVLVLNFQDQAAVRSAPVPRRPWGRRVGLAGVAVAAPVWLALAWLGWLHAGPNSARRCGWELAPDERVARPARQRAAWREAAGLTAADHAFHTSLDSAHYAAWFVPGEGCFVDHRLNLFSSRVAADYRLIARELGSRPDDPAVFPQRETAEALREWGINTFVVSGPDPTRLRASLRRLWSSAELALLGLEGREVVFGWRTNPRLRAVADRDRLDLGALAYVPPEQAAAVARLAPTEAPERCWAPAALPGWARRLAPAPRPSADAGTAALLLDHADHQAEARAAAVERERLALYLAGTVAEAPRTGGPGAGSAVAVRLTLMPALLPPADAVGPSVPLLAVRAARRAVAESPDDPLAYLQLGRAYLALSYATREFRWADSCRPLAQMRHVQTVAALERAVALDPGLEDAHALLYRVYSERRMFDAAIAHLREQMRLARRRGRDSGELAQTLEVREALVNDRRGELAVRSQGLGSKPLVRAQAALRLGLSQTALDEVLLPSDVILFGQEGARLELELLLMLGRPYEAGQKLDSPEVRAAREKLGDAELPGPGPVDRPPFYRLPALDWYGFLAAAARGDYDRAEELLLGLAGRLAQERQVRLRRAVRGLPIYAGTVLGLATAPSCRLVADILGNEIPLVGTYRLLNRIDVQVEADLRTLAGLLALERGVPARAADHFRRALAAAASPDGDGAGFAGEPICRAHLARLRE